MTKQVFEGSAWLSDYMQHALGDTAQLNAREGIALTLATISLEHREALLLLVHAGARTSVGTVLRSALESYVGSSWVQYCARDEALVQFGQGRSPSFERKVQALRKTHPIGEVFEGPAAPLRPR